MRTCALRVRVRSLCASGRVSKRAHAMTRCDVLRRAQVRRARALRPARFAGSVHTQARNHGERAPGCAGRRACVLAPLAPWQPSLLSCSPSRAAPSGAHMACATSVEQPLTWRQRGASEGSTGTCMEECVRATHRLRVKVKVECAGTAGQRQRRLAVGDTQKLHGARRQPGAGRATSIAKPQDVL